MTLPNEHGVDSITLLVFTRWKQDETPGWGAGTYFPNEDQFEEMASEVAEIARHDMDADLFNELAELLMTHPHRRALFALERLRSQYGASTRRHLGLDPKKGSTHG